MNRFSIRVLFILVPLFTLTFAACTPRLDEPVRVGTNVWLGYEPLYLARSLKYFSNEDVKLVEFVSSSQTMRGLIDGVIDVGALTLDEALRLREQGADISIVLILDYSAGGDALVANSSIKTHKDLRGKRIGVETTAVGAYVMHRFLETSGLTLADITVVSLPISQHEQSFFSRKVDAVVTFEPVRQHLIKSGGKVLFHTGDIPGEVIDVLVVRNRFKSERKNALEKLTTAWFRAVEYINNNNDAAARLMDVRMKLGTEQLAIALNGISFADKSENASKLLGNPPPLLRQTEHLTSYMLANHLLRERTMVENLFDAESYRELLQ